jgi:addiction module RelE/StbE family toxin
MEVVWLHRAQQHLAEIVLYIAEDNRTAALSVRQRIENAANSLPAHPDMGRQGRIDGTRELIIGGLPYIIPYRVRQRRVEILAVIHAARRWPKRL